MRIVVTGATGNVGTSVVESLAGDPQVDEIVGLARRRPAWDPPKTSWIVADVLSSDLVEAFHGADAVVHLAWAIQPSHDLAALERVNVDGSRRVFDAVARAGVPKLVYASSVGAYSRGPKDRPVDESWPTEGIPTSFYSRHKVAVERILDEMEAREAIASVVRLRPALIGKEAASSEVRRLFLGRFFPSFALRPSLVPLMPRIPGLRTQMVHSRDVGDAFRLAALRDVGGAFNVAAEPPIEAETVASLLEARTFSVPAPVARALADLSWRLRLQPSPPGWLDMGLGAPLLSSERARRELGWEPRNSGVDALRETIEGMRRGEGFPTPPLERDGVEDKLDKYLADLHSIEEQALAQMRAAPRIAGDPRLAEAFEEHLPETEAQGARVRARLAARSADPSRVKDLAGRAGAYGMVLFARSQPDTPGKLAAHAYSYEHMEITAYRLLQEAAERLGDEETAAMADEIAAEERRMAGRLEDLFDVAAEASLDAVPRASVDEQLDRYLADAHAIEEQALRMLRSSTKLADDEELERLFARHLDQTKRHAELVEARLEARGASPSALKDAALRLGGLNLGGFFAAQPDTTAKLAGFAFAFEHLEIAAYELLRRVARRAGDEEAESMAEAILEEERSAAAAFAGSWDRPQVPLGSSA